MALNSYILYLFKSFIIPETSETLFLIFYIKKIKNKFYKNFYIVFGEKKFLKFPVDLNQEFVLSFVATYPNQKVEGFFFKKKVSEVSRFF